MPAAPSKSAAGGSGPAVGPAARPARMHCKALPLVPAAAGGACSLAASGGTSKWLVSAQSGTNAAPHARRGRAVAAASIHAVPAEHAPPAPAAPSLARSGGDLLLAPGLPGPHGACMAAAGALPCLCSGGASGALPPLLPVPPPRCSPYSSCRRAATGAARGEPALRGVAIG